MPSDLLLLAAYRAHGQAPTLPIFVTDTRGPFAQSMRESGALVIQVWNLADARAWDWSAVAGLEVLMAFAVPNCDGAFDLARALKAARPRCLRVIDWSAPEGERISSMMPVLH